jgi:hypothetical protein
MPVLFTHHVVLLLLTDVRVETVVVERRFREGFRCRHARAPRHAMPTTRSTPLQPGSQWPVHLFFSGACASLGSLSLQAA